MRFVVYIAVIFLLASCAYTGYFFGNRSRPKPSEPQPVVSQPAPQAVVAPPVVDHVKQPEAPPVSYAVTSRLMTANEAGKQLIIDCLRVDTETWRAMDCSERQMEVLKEMYAAGDAASQVHEVRERP